MPPNPYLISSSPYRPPPEAKTGFWEKGGPEPVKDIRFLPFPCFLIVSEALRLQLSPYPQYVALSSPQQSDVPVQFQDCQFQFGLGRLKSEAVLVGIGHYTPPF